MKKDSISIFFPCYNDAATIGGLVATADRVARGLTDDYEIIVVDDGSQDNSRQLLLSLKDKYPQLRLIFHAKNKGYGAAIRSGFHSCVKELTFYTDGDGQYDVRELSSLLALMREGVDIVNGYKINRSDPFYRRAVGAVYLRLMRCLFNFHIKDVDCDFRLIRRRVFDAIKLRYDSAVICLELVKKMELAGCRFIECPVHHYHRVAGKSQIFKPARLIRTGADIIKLWWQLMVLR